MTLLLLLGFLGVVIVLFMRNQLVDLNLENHKLILNLRSTKWFYNHWKSGIILFILNALLFFLLAF